MAITKTNASIWSSTTLTAGAGNTTSTANNLSAVYATTLNIKLVNGATGPTVPAQVQIMVSNDGTNYYNFGGPLVGSITNSATSQWGGIEIPMAVRNVQLVAGSNTGQNVTVSADISTVTAV